MLLNTLIISLLTVGVNPVVIKSMQVIPPGANAIVHQHVHMTIGDYIITKDCHGYCYTLLRTVYGCDIDC